jgi:hypothetical protein
MCWKKNQVLFVLLLRIIINNKSLWFCQRQIMSGFTFAFKNVNLLEIIIILFIRYVLNYGFVKKNRLMKIRLRRLSLLCFYQIESWSINTVLGITNTTQNLCTISFRQKSIMNSPWEIITNVMLVRSFC